MKKTKKHLPGVCLWAGIGLVAAAAAVMLLWQWQIQTTLQQIQSYTQTIYRLIPEPQGAAAESRKDNTMPVLSVEETDFIGILEIPGYGCALPVQATWGDPGKMPSRFSGSVYDGTLQIGATTQRGQCDFYREISVGDLVRFTDVEGNCYSYTVTALRYADHADRQTLAKTPAQLTLFIKNIYAFEYLIISCDPI